MTTEPRIGVQRKRESRISDVPMSKKFQSNYGNLLLPPPLVSRPRPLASVPNGTISTAATSCSRTAVASCYRIAASVVVAKTSNDYTAAAKTICNSSCARIPASCVKIPDSCSRISNSCASKSPLPLSSLSPVLDVSSATSCPTCGTEQVVEKRQTAHSVIVFTRSFACPRCRFGILVRDFTFCGICLAFLLFPLGIGLCYIMRRYRCGMCGYSPVPQHTIQYV